MRESDVIKLINKAKEFSQNSFVLHTGEAVGACVLTSDNMVFGGCAIENFSLPASTGAAAVAVLKAVSEGYTNIKVVCIYTEGEYLPAVMGNERDIIFQFGQDAEVILACDAKHEKYKMYELLPFTKRDKE